MDGPAEGLIVRRGNGGSASQKNVSQGGAPFSGNGQVVGFQLYSEAFFDSGCIKVVHPSRGTPPLHSTTKGSYTSGVW